MNTQNITLSIPKEILIQVKVIAARRQTSVSRMLTEMLEKLVRQEGVYGRAKSRHLDWLKGGQDLGTQGTITVTRDELHERSR